MSKYTEVEAWNAMNNNWNDCASRLAKLIDTDIDKAFKDSFREGINLKLASIGGVEMSKFQDNVKDGKYILDNVSSGISDLEDVLERLSMPDVVEEIKSNNKEIKKDITSMIDRRNSVALVDRYLTDSMILDDILHYLCKLDVE